MQRTKILILDNHRMIRELWMYVLGEIPEYKVVGATGKWKEGLATLRTTRPNIIILDIQLLAASGYDTIPQILEILPSAAIIATSGDTEPAMARWMTLIGARGYITKNSPLTELFRAIEKLAQGKSYICNEIARAAKKTTRKKSAGIDFRLLTERERQVLHEIAKGFSSREIAGKLGITIKTVEVHRHNIFRKLNIKNTPQLVRLVMMTK